jgi:hypothetical protein
MSATPVSVHVLAQRFADHLGVARHLHRTVRTHRHPVRELSAEQVTNGLTPSAAKEQRRTRCGEHGDGRPTLSVDHSST